MLIIQNLWELILFLTILAAPLPLCLSFTLHNQKEKSNYSFAHCGLVTLIVWSIIQIGLGLILGTFEKLTLTSVIFTEIIIFVIGFSLIFGQNHNFLSWIQKLPKIKQPFNKMELLIIGATAFVAVILLETITTKSITNYDSLWFHLPVISRWYQTGALTLLDNAGHWMFEHPDAKFYPYNWHILNLLCVLPFGEDFLVAFPQIIAWIIQGLSVYLLSIYFGANRLNSMAAASLLLTVPMVINQVNTIHIDLPLSALFTSSLYLALSYYRNRNRSDLALFFATLGLFAGIKITAIIYGALIIKGLVILESKKIWSTPKNIKLDFQLKSPLIFLGITLLLFLGGFWYVRNLLHINYPIQNFTTVFTPSLPVASPPINSELSKYLMLWKSTLLAQFDVTKISNWQVFGLQLIFRLQLPLMVMLCQIVALPFLAIKSKILKIDEKFICLTLLLIGTGFLYFITPYSSGTDGYIPGYLHPLLGFNLRYGFPFLSMITVAVAVSATLVKTPKKLIVLTVLISSIIGIVSSEIFDVIKNSSFTGNKLISGGQLINEFKSSPLAAGGKIFKLLADNLIDIWVYLIIYSLFICFLSWLLSQDNSQGKFLTNLWSSFQRFSRTFVIVFCLGLIVSATWVLREKKDINRTEIYGDVYEYIANNTLPNEKIGFFLSHRSYLLYGKNLNRQVLYVPLKGKLNQMSKWVDNLRQNKVKIVLAGPLIQNDENTKKIVSWLTSDDGYLEAVAGEDFYQKSVLYRVKGK
jgi:hypothetical protein